MQNSLPDSYLDLTEAMPHMASLGYNNQEQVRYAIRKNLFRLGIEVSDTSMPGAARPTYRINPVKCRERLLESPAKRSLHKRGRPPIHQKK
jgi:hypothetical protein